LLTRMKGPRVCSGAKLLRNYEWRVAARTPSIADSLGSRDVTPKIFLRAAAN
jgi:hypothetical protein